VRTTALPDDNPWIAALESTVRQVEVQASRREFWERRNNRVIAVANLLPGRSQALLPSLIWI
jgi:hypothetical protein